MSKNPVNDGASERNTLIEALLSEYPDIDGAELDVLVRWFKKEASALDVAMLASEPRLAEPYRRFKADHIDRLTLSDLWKASGAILAIAFISGLFVWWKF